LLALFVLDAGAQTPAIVINEINYAPSGASNPAEFIELYNNGATNVDLSGWKFDAGVTYTFPAATTLAAHGYLVISGDTNTFAARWGFTPLGPWSGKLSNSGEQVRLRDAANNTVDSLTYGVGFPWPTAACGDGSSMELINPGLDNDLAGSWRSSGQPAGAGQPQIYVPPTAVDWHYRKGTNEASSPVSAWRQLNFVENGTWLTGQTSIGFGDDDDNTILTDMQNNYSSLFLRRVFSIDPGAKPTAVKLKVRVDDGCIIWINGVEVARFHLATGLVPAYNSLAQNHEADIVAFESTNVFNADAFLVEGQNLVAVQAFNTSLTSSDFTIDVSVEELPVTGGTTPTPGAVNSCFAANAPPAIRQVNHLPIQPTSGQPVTVIAKVTDPDGVAAVSLKYQVVNPGTYIRKTDVAYTNWTTVPMYDDGTHGDTNSADGIYTAVIPGSVQVHRRLMRYKIVATDAGAHSIEVPYADDGSPNFAYFVFNGFTNWTGAFNPGVTANATYSSNVLQSLPTYQLIASSNDVVNSQYVSSYNGQRFYGTLIYNGKVYDHIQFNNRGEASTYTSGKNKWRFHFNTAHDLQALDNWGRPYAETWDELNLNACASPWCAVHRGMSGVEEAVSLRLFELLGMASPKSHFLQLRVIDDASETAATQFQGGDPAGVIGGDLWGLYLAVEQPDGSFLDERGLPDGNLYKIESSGGDQKHQGDGQATDGSDWTSFLAACKASPTEAWWRTNLNLDAYYNFHAANRIVGNVDLRDGFNHYFYHAPDGRWQVIPWDVDMMFIAKTHQPSDATSRADYTITGTIDQRRALTLPALKIESQNRQRELLDLVCADTNASGGQIGQLIDEYARLVAPTGQATNWTTLDAAMWNYNPRTPTTSNLQTDHRGHFYTTPYTDSRRGGTWVRTLTTPDFAGSMKYLLDYATDTFPTNSTWALNNGDQRGYGYQFLKFEAADLNAPSRPAATYLGLASHPLDDLRFSASAYAGSNTFVAAQWRVGEISAPGIPLYDATKPRIYEVSDVWRSAELTTNGVVTLPSAALQIGHTYRVRVRHKDVTGRWSRWSEAAQFVPTIALPPAWPLASGPYAFTNWDAAAPASTYPPYMQFYQAAASAGDPGLADEMDSLWTLPYNLTSRSRLNGLGTNGFAFINTDNAQTNAGAGFLGAAILSLNTTGKENIRVTWTGGTVTPNTQSYGLRLQYRLGADGPFSDVLDAQSNVVEYLRNAQAGHAAILGPVTLPAAVNNQPYIQLRWKYYRISGGSGSRAQLRVANILVVAAQPPVLANIADKFVHLGQTMQFTAVVTNSLSTQPLTFSLTNSPVGAGINPTNGALLWAVTNVATPSTNIVTVRVADSGVPPLSDAKTFSVIVQPPPRFSSATYDGNGSVNFTFTSLSGQSYQLEYKNNLADPVWTPLGSPVAGTGGTRTLSDVIAGYRQRFYRLAASN
jgi:hypothetical protein